MPEVIFTGPGGRLEGRYHQAQQKNAPIAIILHPHPAVRGHDESPDRLSTLLRLRPPSFRCRTLQFPWCRTQSGRLRPWPGRIVRRRRGARLGAVDQSGSAQLLDRRLLVRRLDRHATPDAASGNRRLHLGRATREPLRFLFPRALPVIGAHRVWRQGRGGAAQGCAGPDRQVEDAKRASSSSRSPFPARTISSTARSNR